MERREFLKNAGLAAAAGAATLAGCSKAEEPKKEQAPAVVTKKVYEWKMATTWPPLTALAAASAASWSALRARWSMVRMLPRDIS